MSDRYLIEALAKHERARQGGRRELCTRCNTYRPRQEVVFIYRENVTRLERFECSNRPACNAREQDCVDPSEFSADEQAARDEEHDVREVYEGKGRLPYPILRNIPPMPARSNEEEEETPDNRTPDERRNDELLERAVSEERDRRDE